MVMVGSTPSDAPAIPDRPSFERGEVTPQAPERQADGDPPDDVRGLRIRPGFDGNARVEIVLDPVEADELAVTLDAYMTAPGEQSPAGDSSTPWHQRRVARGDDRIYPRYFRIGIRACRIERPLVRQLRAYFQLGSI